MLKISFFKARKIILISFVSVLIFIGGYLVGINGFQAKVDKAKKINVVRELPPEKSDLDFSLFWKTWDTLEARYFDKSKIDNRKMIYGAIEGMVRAIGDPYTVFLSPDDNKVVNEDLQGSFEGVGIQLGFRGNQLAVITPLPGSPAEKAGIKAGDFIVGIKDDENQVETGTVGLSLPDAVKLIRGKAGSKVTLLLTRDGINTSITVELERAKLDIPSVIVTFVGQKESIARIQLLKFGADTNGEWDKQIKSITEREGVMGVILDLRGNPGGYLEGAVDIAGEFMQTGSVVVVEERSDGKKNEFKTQRIGYLTQTPLVVLVNGGSASAAEILAGALKDAKRAKIVGDTTFGKGSIQEPLELDGGSGLHITIAKWLTPSGYWVNEKGLEPDVKIKDDEKTKEDEQLQEAIKLLEKS